MGAAKVGTSSPPTQRVVSVLALLAECPSEALGASEVARRLGLHKSTCHNILSTLSQAGLLARSDADKTYTLGPALVRLGEAARRGLPLLRKATPLIADLTQALGYGSWLSVLEGDALRTLEAAADERALPFGPRAGRRHPFGPPFGAAIVAFSDEATQARWISLAGAPDAEEARMRRMLMRIRKAGIGIWRLDQPLELVATRMRLAASWLEPAEAGPGLDPTLALYLTNTGNRTYSETELAQRGHGSVSTMLAPVFDDSSTASFEVGLAVFRERMSFREIRLVAQQLRATAVDLTGALGGTAPDDRALQ